MRYSFKINWVCRWCNLEDESTRFHRVKGDCWRYNYEAYDLTCAVDGAWKVLNNGHQRGAIGGFIKNKKGIILYIFSILIDASSSLDTELEALLYDVKIISSNFASKHNAIICSDSTEAIRVVRSGIYYNSCRRLEP